MSASEYQSLTVNQRVRVARETLKLTQAQFSKVISISNGYIAGVELGKRRANDRILKLICSSFSVNDHWIRTGKGEIFNKNPEKEFTHLVSLYRELKPKYKDYVLKQVNLLLKLQDEADEY
jgi:transcriptional regulator with XRE-family HTH domain